MSETSQDPHPLPEWGTRVRYIGGAKLLPVPIGQTGMVAEVDDEHREAVVDFDGDQTARYGVAPQHLISEAAEWTPPAPSTPELRKTTYTYAVPGEPVFWDVHKGRQPTGAHQPPTRLVVDELTVEVDQHGAAVEARISGQRLDSAGFRVGYGGTAWYQGERFAAELPRLDAAPQWVRDAVDTLTNR